MDLVNDAEISAEETRSGLKLWCAPPINDDGLSWNSRGRWRTMALSIEQQNIATLIMLTWRSWRMSYSCDGQLIFCNNLNCCAPIKCCCKGKQQTSAKPILAEVVLWDTENYYAAFVWKEHALEDGRVNWAITQVVRIKPMNMYVAFALYVADETVPYSLIEIVKVLFIANEIISLNNCWLHTSSIKTRRMNMPLFRLKWIYRALGICRVHCWFLTFVCSFETVVMMETLVIWNFAPFIGRKIGDHASQKGIAFGRNEDGKLMALSEHYSPYGNYDPSSTHGGHGGSFVGRSVNCIAVNRRKSFAELNRKWVFSQKKTG